MQDSIAVATSHNLFGMTEFWYSVWTGFVTSVFASLFFYLFLWLLKPNLRLSPVICHQKLMTRDGEKEVYGFKVINDTLFHKVIDVKVELLLLEDVNTAGGTNVFLQSLKLRKDQIWYIKSKQSKEKGAFAFVFYTEENLGAIWTKEHQRIQVQLYCKHSLSGFSKVFAETYYTKKSCIYNGKFKFGDSFNIS